MKAFIIGEIYDAEERSLIFSTREAAEMEAEHTGQSSKDIKEIVIIPKEELREKLNTILGVFHKKNVTIMQWDKPQRPQTVPVKSLINDFLEEISQ